jgi:hypothetical protein
MTTRKPPSQPEKDQSQYGIAQTEMPQHGVAPQIARDDQANHTSGQCPMEQASGQIPNANCEHGHFHESRKEKDMRN